MDGSITALEKETPSRARAYLAVIATSILHLSTGAVMSWSSPMIPQLNLNNAEQTLVGSLYSLGAAPGPFIVTLCIDTIGRKGTVYVLWSSFIISWILLMVSKNVVVIYIARLIGGVGVGGCCAGLPLFVSELAITEIRGRLGSLSFLFIGIGSLIVLGIGPKIGYYPLSIYGLTIGFAFLVVFYFVPESPYFYLRKGRRLEAKESIRRLKGYTSEEAVEMETDEIERVIFQEQQNAVSFWIAIRTKAALKAIGIGVFLLLLQQFAGGNPISAYCQTIFENAKLNFRADIVPLLWTLSSLFGFLSVVLINSCLTMKLAVVISGTGCGIFMGLVGIYFYLINSGHDLYDYSYISVIALILGNIFTGLGAGPLVWPMVAELLPPAVKGIGTGICGFISSLTGFILIALFSAVAGAYGYSTSFFGIAALSIITTMISIFIVPDTTGKSFQEIQDLLSK